MSPLIAASILSADLTHLQEEVDSVSSADWLQIDVMDGHFVPNLSFGMPVIKSLKTKLPLDIHLMVENPDDRLEEFLELGVKNVSFHAEAISDTLSRRALIAAIRDGGASAGIALNPKTPLSAIDDIVSEVDLVLIMSVEPGFGGQAFQEGVLSKVAELRQNHPDLMIQMDGGINAKTAPLCVKAGADNLVVGSALFQAKDRAAFLTQLRG